MHVIWYSILNSFILIIKNNNYKFINSNNRIVQAFKRIQLLNHVLKLI